jgi:alpha-amylase/alpha-mannosidase (GH57 family)
MERFVCIHAHFYQPPRENPWLETIEAQDSAYPFHDWNERITAECYAPNGASRILNDEKRIAEITNNYSRISFNFGPTLLSWMKDNAKNVYKNILEADRLSRERFSGHGSAMAQAYNHMILPLASAGDKETQIIWGIRDFESRFGRAPEGMWLAETAANLEVLDMLAQHGIKFTVLSPYQAGRVRKIGGRSFKDVRGGRIDPTRAYLQRLPSGRSIALFFYDGPISQAVAFEKLLNSGEQFADRLVSGFSDDRDWPQLMHIATDGESYGHHHKHGEMALAYALKHIEDNDLARLTNYGEYLERFPPEMEVQIIENSSWSCSHGVERWKSDCGCCAGGHEWNQQWRGPLRMALDYLRDAVAPLFEECGRRIFADPWAARNDYISVMLDRRREIVNAFFGRNAHHWLSASEHVTALKFMELQRHAMLMYTSCGWFFDELSGIETVKVMEYAGRVLQLASELFAERAAHLEPEFLSRIAQAQSNIPEMGTGADIFARSVKPAMIALKDVAAHFAISALFEPTAEEVPIYAYSVETDDFQKLQAGKTQVAIGKARICSQITEECGLFSFAVLHFGDSNISAGVREFGTDDTYKALIKDVRGAFRRVELSEVIRLLDRHFGNVMYTIKSLFKDEQRKIMDTLLASTLKDAEASYRQVYEHHAPLIRYMATLNMPLPEVLRVTAEFVLNSSLKRELSSDAMDAVAVRTLLEQAHSENIPLDSASLAFSMERTLTRLMAEFCREAGETSRLDRLIELFDLARSLDLPVNMWKSQNMYYTVAEKHLESAGAEWLERFTRLGELMYIATEQFNRRVAEETLALAG